MKTNDFKVKIWFANSKFSLLPLAVLFTVFTIGCGEDEAVPESEPVAYVSLIHMAPIASSLTIFADNNRVNTNRFAYTDYTGYLRFYTGKRTLRFTSFNNSTVILLEDISLAQDSIYSVFVTGALDDLQLMVVNDRIKLEDQQNSLIRILHVSPDAPSVDLVFSGLEQLTFSNISYRNISEFKEITSGSASLEIKNADTGELMGTVSDYNFLSEAYYTIIVRGYADPQDGNQNQWNIQVIRNFFNF
jgi:hypothetical protein